MVITKTFLYKEVRASYIKIDRSIYKHPIGRFKRNKLKPTKLEKYYDL